MTPQLDTLRHVPLFRSLTDDERHRLDTQCDTDVFFVISGVVRALIHGSGGREVILGDIGAGEFFGEFAAIDGQPRSASVVAVTGATIARMPAWVFRETIHRHPDSCDQVLELIAARLRLLDRRVPATNETGAVMLCKQGRRELPVVNRRLGYRIDPSDEKPLRSDIVISARSLLRFEPPKIADGRVSGRRC